MAGHAITSCAQLSLDKLNIHFVMIIKMDIYGNNHHVFTIALNGFCRTDYADSKLQQKLIKTGNTIIGSLNMGGNKISSVLGSTLPQDVATKNYADTLNLVKLTKSGETMSGSIDMSLNHERQY